MHKSWDLVDEASLDHVLKHEYRRATGYLFCTRDIDAGWLSAAGKFNLVAARKNLAEAYRLAPRKLDYAEERRLCCLVTSEAERIAEFHAREMFPRDFNSFGSLADCPEGLPAVVDPEPYFLVLQYYYQGFLPLFLVAISRPGTSSQGAKALTAPRAPRSAIRKLNKDLVRLVVRMVVGK